MQQIKKSNFGIILIMVTITILMLFKIYLANQTYYISRDIQKITTKINALKEERNILKLKIEKLRYKNTITDPLFSYEPKKIDKDSIAKSEKIINNKEKKPKSPIELFETIPAGEQY